MASRLFFVGLLAGSLWLSGCGDSGPELGDVHGTVNMDGKPLKLADVTFRRKDFTGRPSVGMTDENGAYTLGYSMDKSGALLGDFVVEISTFRDMPGKDADGKEIPPSPETVPMQYNAKSELTAKVESGGQEINFDLKSDGKILNRGKKQFK